MSAHIQVKEKNTMKHPLKSIVLLMVMGNLAFIGGCSNNREWAGENRSKEYARNSFNKEVIGFKSDYPQSDWDLKRQTGRLIGAEPILFIDDDFILARKGLTRTLHPLEKQPGPLTCPRTEIFRNVWTHVEAMVPALDGKSFLAYCSNRYADKDTVIFTVYSTIDGIHFEPINVDQIPPEQLWDDSPKGELPEHNNVLLFDEGYGPLFQYYDATFCKIPEETEYPYRALLINKLPPPSKGGIWRSKDGLKWELLPNQHKLHVPFEANKPTYDPFKNRYLAYLRLWDPPAKPVSSWRKVLFSESITTKRGIDWTEKELVFEANEADGPTTDVYNMQVTAYAGVYIGFPEMFQRKGFKPELQGTLYNELAFSQDGRNWQRISQGQAFLPLGSPGNWDHGMVRIMSNPVIINNELYFYFQGIRGLHIHPQKPGWGQRECGLATLRLDGFCSLDAGPEGGTLLTVPFWPKGKHLYINADAREGEIRVEVLQEYSAPGNKETGLFGLENCIPFSGDALAHRVEWKRGENFMDDFPDGWNVDLQNIDEGKTRNFSKRAIELRIHLRDAKLYSIWFADGPMPYEAGRLNPE